MIEAAPERVDLKRELFSRLSEVCGPETVLATNTSSIPVTSLAGVAARPENVVGMHFFGEPRWRPSPLQTRMVAAGRLGRKSGRGWYEYGEGRPHRPEDPLAPDPRGDAAGFARRAGSGGAMLVSCGASSLAAQGRTDAVGFNLLPPLDATRLVELARLPATPEASCRAAESAATELGLEYEWVDDGPGLVLGRIVCCLINEAAFAIGEGVGSAEDVDAGMTLGLNHPRGPVAWSEAIGLGDVLATIDALWEERREERYRAAPLLRRAAALGQPLSRS